MMQGKKEAVVVLLAVLSLLPLVLANPVATGPEILIIPAIFIAVVVGIIFLIIYLIKKIKKSSKKQVKRKR